MTTANQTQEADPEADTGGQDGDVDTEDQPEIEADEMADLPGDLADKVEAETAPESDNEGADSDDESGGESPDVDATDGLDAPDADSWGDWYVGTLTAGSNAIIEEYGDDDADPLDEALARQFGLDDAVDRLMAERGQPDMPPEQQLLFGTLCFLLAVGVWKTDLFSELLADADLSR